MRNVPNRHVFEAVVPSRWHCLGMVWNLEDMEPRCCSNGHQRQALRVEGLVPAPILLPPALYLFREAFLFLDKIGLELVVTFLPLLPVLELQV